MFATCLCHVLFHVTAVGKLGKCQVYGLVLCFMPCFYFMFDHVFVNKLHLASQQACLQWTSFTSNMLLSNWEAFHQQEAISFQIDNAATAVS